MPPSPRKLRGTAIVFTNNNNKESHASPPLQFLGCSLGQPKSVGQGGGGGETVGGEADERGERRLRDKKGGGKGAERVERESWTETKAQRERSGEGREK